MKKSEMIEFIQKSWFTNMNDSRLDSDDKLWEAIIDDLISMGMLPPKARIEGMPGEVFDYYWEREDELRKQD